MNKKVKSLLVSLGIITFLAIALAVWIYLSAQQEFTKYEQRQADLEKKNTYLQEKLDSTVRQTRLLEEKSGQITAALNQLTQEHSSLLSQHQRLAQERESLAGQLARLEKERAALEKQLQDARKEAEALSNKLLREEKKEAASIQLSPIIVKAEGATPTLPIPTEPSRMAMAQTALEGEIITINDRHSFVVIDLGKDEGVQKGMSFDVYRNGKKVGRIQVIETRKSIAACDIKQMSTRLKLNDVVRR